MNGLTVGQPLCEPKKLGNYNFFYKKSAKKEVGNHSVSASLTIRFVLIPYSCAHRFLLPSHSGQHNQHD